MLHVVNDPYLQPERLLGPGKSTKGPRAVLLALFYALAPSRVTLLLRFQLM